MKDGKLVVEFPINVWPGWAPIIVANAGMEPNDQSVFAKKYGFYVHLAIVDDPVKARDLFASGQSHILWGTLDMIALFAPELVKDSRTVPVVCQQIDFSAGGDGIVARGEIRSINDFRIKNGKRKKVVLAQNSPSHYLIMSLLIDAGIDPGDIDFKWAADAPSAAKIFVQDPSFDAFVGWSPDIYNVTDKLKGSRLVVTTGTANHLIADVWAVRNDFYRDHPGDRLRPGARHLRRHGHGAQRSRKRPPGPGHGLQAARGGLREDGRQGRRDRRGRCAPDQLPREREVLPRPVQPGQLRSRVEQRLHHLQVARARSAPPCRPPRSKPATILAAHVRGLQGCARPLAADLQAGCADED